MQNDAYKLRFFCFKHCEIKTCHVIYEKGINQYLIVRLNFECFLPLKYIWEIHRADKGIFRDYGWMQKTEELADIIIRLVATLVKDRTFISIWGFQRHWDNGIFYTTGGNKTTSKQTSLLNLCSWFFTYGFFFLLNTVKGNGRKIWLGLWKYVNVWENIKEQSFSGWM